MSSVDTIEKLSTSFLWPSKEALPLMKKSIKDDLYCPAIEARCFFVAQIVSSIVAIPFMLIASFFVMLWKMCHLEFKEALMTVPAAIIFSGFHLCTTFASVIAAIAPMDWTSKSLDCFQFERPEALQPAPHQEA